MYYDFYHLKQDPFAEAPDPEFLFLSRSHKAALHAMICGLEEHQPVIAISGEAGLGKTTILQVMQERIQQQGVQTIVLPSPNCSFRQVFTLLCHECGLTTNATHPTAIHSLLQQALQQGRQNGWQVVLIIDDAHQMPVETLASVLWLSDGQTPQGESVLPTILAGLPQLQQTLQLPQLSPLQQRPAVQVMLTPLSEVESLAYIRHRLTKVLMPEDALLSAGAVKRVIRAARGNPRVLNMLCTRLLTVGATRQQKPVSARMAREVLAGMPTQRKWTGMPWRRGLSAGLLLGMGLMSPPARMPPHPTGHQARVVAPMHTAHFHSQPEAATVTINGTVVGETPVTTPLRLGSHTIVVEKTGHTRIQYSIMLDRSGESHFSHELQVDRSEW